jgi:hypothetical protein
MPEIDASELVHIVRANPPPSIIAHYVPTEDKCPHCGENRKSGTNWGVGPRGFQTRTADPNIAIKFRTIAGKKTVLLGKKICTDDCLAKELTEMIEEESPVALDILKQFALQSGFGNGTAFKVDVGDTRNRGLMFWDDNIKEVIPADSDLNGGYGGVPINFLIGDGDFTPTDWEDDFLMGIVEAYPNMKLIVEMRNYAAAHPEDKKMEVTINGNDFEIRYNPTEMSGEWESCTLMLRNGSILKAAPGDKRKRNTIKIADDAALKEAEEHVAAKVAASANNAPNNAYVPNTPEEAAAKAADRKAALAKYSENLGKAFALPKFNARRRQAVSKAKANLNATYAAISKRRTVKNANANARAKNAALMGLVAEHLNGNNTNGVLATEINRLKKNGGARKTRKRRY